MNFSVIFMVYHFHEKMDPKPNTSVRALHIYYFMYFITDSYTFVSLEIPAFFYFLNWVLFSNMVMLVNMPIRMRDSYNILNVN